MSVSDKLYEAWHEKLGHREYRLSVTMRGYGSDPDDAEALLDGFLEKHPEFGPVVSQNTEANTITVAFALKASDPDHAISLAQVVFSEGGAASGLAPAEVSRIELEPVAPDEEVGHDQPRLSPQLA